jgi:hypothetical protein
MLDNLVDIMEMALLTVAETVLEQLHHLQLPQPLQPQRQLPQRQLPQRQLPQRQLPQHQLPQRQLPQRQDVIVKRKDVQINVV